MEPTKDVIEWLKTHGKDSWVGIDEGGLTLVEVTEKGNMVQCFDVGGIPETIENNQDEKEKIQ